MIDDVIRVVLADDHSVVRAGLKAVLGVAKDIEVIGEAKTGREAVTLAERFKPDVIVMDLSMPEMDGTAATKEIVAKGLATRVLILTMHAEEDYLVPLIEAGAAGYLVKSAADRELVDAVRAVAHGDVYVRAVRGARAREESHEERSGAERTRTVREAHSTRARRACASSLRGTPLRRSARSSSSARRPSTRTNSAFRRSWVWRIVRTTFNSRLKLGLSTET